MPKPPRPWIVTPHGPIEIIDDNLWGVTGEVPDFPKGTGMRRRMSIVKLSDGRLVFHNAVPLEDAALAHVKPLEDFKGDAALSWTYLRGTRFQEPAFTVHTGPRASLLFVDAWHNSRPGKGVNAAIFRLLGFTGDGPRTPPFYKWRAVTNREDLKADLLRLADTPGLARLVPSHGFVVEERPMETLRETVHHFL